MSVSSPARARAKDHGRLHPEDCHVGPRRRGGGRTCAGKFVDNLVLSERSQPITPARLRPVTAVCKLDSDYTERGAGLLCPQLGRVSKPEDALCMEAKLDIAISDRDRLIGAAVGAARGRAG